MHNSAHKKKKLFLPILLGLIAGFYSFVLVINYGPRKRSFWDSMLRPNDPFELYDFNGLTDFGKTLALIIPLCLFTLSFFLVYKYVNKEKLKDSDNYEDIE